MNWAKTAGPDFALSPGMDAVARVLPIVPGAPLVSAPPRRRRLRILLAILASALSGGILSGLVWVHRFATSIDSPAPARPPAPLAALSNHRPVAITMTTPAWTKVRETVTVDQLHTDHRLWRQMHFGDWDAVDPIYRTSALRAMIRSYKPLFAGPAGWRHMTAADWDDVPQPVRSMAYLRMIWYWAGVERVGEEFGLVPGHVAQTIGAIVMAESWFEHRAFNENPWGNRDFGLAQCSDYCREEIAAMVARCELLFRPGEADYFNPWTATRIATVWFKRELRLAEGDVDLATRAYHRGLERAHDEKGDVYIAKVQQLRDRYIRAQGSSETWRLLVREIGAL
jgi:hypothetical protein